MPLLEVAVDSLEDAVAAERAGADRLELVADLQTQGLTAPRGLISGVKAAVKIPVMAMVRPREGDFVYPDSEAAQMEDEVRAAIDAGADGVVLGMLTETGYIDRRRVRTMVRIADGFPVAFHRAFDFAQDAQEALEELIMLGVTRVLTAGVGTWATPSAGDALMARCKRVLALNEQSAGRIEILPGGGVRAANAAQWLHVTGCSQLHSACRGGVGIPCSTRNGLDPAMVAELRTAMDGPTLFA